MISAKDLAAKLKTLQEEEDARLAAIKDNVIAINTVVTSAVFTEPNSKGEIYCRLTLQDKVPAYTKKGTLIKTNSILLFKNQIISAMAETAKFAIFANFSYLNEKVESLQRLSTILCGQPIQLKYVELNAGDKYVDPATGNVSDKVAAASCIRYSITSIGSIAKTTSDKDI